jgi:hypothetical protein
MIGLRGADAFDRKLYLQTSVGRGQGWMNDWELPMMNLFAVFPAGRLASAKARAFASFVEQSMTERPQDMDPNPYGVPHLLPQPT